MRERLDLGRYISERWYNAYEGNKCSALVSRVRHGLLTPSLVYRSRLNTFCLLGKNAHLTSSLTSSTGGDVCHLTSVTHQSVVLGIASLSSGELRVYDLQSAPECLVNQRRGYSPRQVGEVWRDDDPRLQSIFRCIKPSLILQHTRQPVTAALPLRSNLIVSGTASRQISVWDLTKPDGGPIQQGGTLGPVRALSNSLSDQPAVIFAALQSGSVARIDLRAPFHEQTAVCSPLHPQQRHRGDILSLAIPPTRQQCIITGGRDTKVKLWDLRAGAAGTFVGDFDDGTGGSRHRFSVRALELLNNGRKVLSRGGWLEDTMVWDVNTRKREPIFFVTENDNFVKRLSLIREGAATALSNLTTQIAVLPSWAGPGGSTCQLAFMPGNGGAVHLFELASGTICATYDRHFNVSSTDSRGVRGPTVLPHAYTSLSVRLHWVDAVGGLLVSAGQAGDVLMYETARGTDFDDQVRYMHV